MTQLASCLGSAFSPGCLSHPAWWRSWLHHPPAVGPVSLDGRWRRSQHPAPSMVEGTRGEHRWQRAPSPKSFS